MEICSLRPLLLAVSYEMEQLRNYWEDYVMTEVDKPKQQEQLIV